MLTFILFLFSMNESSRSFFSCVDEAREFESKDFIATEIITEEVDDLEFQKQNITTMEEISSCGFELVKNSLKVNKDYYYNEQDWVYDGFETIVSENIGNSLILKNSADGIKVAILEKTSYSGWASGHEMIYPIDVFRSELSCIIDGLKNGTNREKKKILKRILNGCAYPIVMTGCLLFPIKLYASSVFVSAIVDSYVMVANAVSQIRQYYESIVFDIENGNNASKTIFRGAKGVEITKFNPIYISNSLQDSHIISISSLSQTMDLNALFRLANDGKIVIIPIMNNGIDISSSQIKPELETGLFRIAINPNILFVGTCDDREILYDSSNYVSTESPINFVAVNIGEELSSKAVPFVTAAIARLKAQYPEKPSFDLVKIFIEEIAKKPYWWTGLEKYRENREKILNISKKSYETELERLNSICKCLKDMFIDIDSPLGAFASKIEDDISKHQHDDKMLIYISEMIHFCNYGTNMVPVKNEDTFKKMIVQFMSKKIFVIKP